MAILAWVFILVLTFKVIHGILGDFDTYKAICKFLIEYKLQESVLAVLYILSWVYLLWYYN